MGKLIDDPHYRESLSETNEHTSVEFLQSVIRTTKKELKDIEKEKIEKLKSIVKLIEMSLKKVEVLHPVNLLVVQEKDLQVVQPQQGVQEKDLL